MNMITMMIVGSYMEKEDGSSKHPIQYGEDAKQCRILQLLLSEIFSRKILSSLSPQSSSSPPSSLSSISRKIYNHHCHHFHHRHNHHHHHHHHHSNLFKDGDSSSDEACKDERQNKKQSPLADLGCYLVHL